MIYLEECEVEKAPLGWNLVDQEGSTQLSIPDGLAACVESAMGYFKPMVAAYNFGHKRGKFSGRSELQAQLRDMLNAETR